jgi:hypothetical protein
MTHHFLSTLIFSYHQQVYIKEIKGVLTKWNITHDRILIGQFQKS